MAKTSVSPIASMIRRLAEDHQAKTLSDQELLRRFSAGQDEVAFGSLLRRHGSMVLNVCRNVAGSEEDAEDAFQATFIVLARKANAIRKMASAASWLHGVAYRTALNGRKTLASRQKHESRAGCARGRESVDDLSWGEAQHLIHAELTAVAARYRAPLVLCFLEGRTQDEAAKQLNISKTTLKKRLERGRALLRLRLLRRGLGPAAILATCSWPAATVSACLPRALATATVEAAAAYAAGQTTAGLVSGQVTILVAGALKATLATKLKVAAAMLLALALVPTLGGWAFHARPANRMVGKGDVVQASTATPTTKFGLAAQATPEEQKKLIISGRVLESAGKPASAAKLFLITSGGILAELGTSDGDGRFAVDVSKRETRSGKGGWLVAKLPGFGIDFIALDDRPLAKDVELRLPPDRPIRGRVIDLQGKAVAGALVRLNTVVVYGTDTVEPFLAGLRKRADLRSPNTTATKAMFGGTQALVFATTNKDGYFEINGVGAERIVRLRITGPGIAQTYAEIITRAGFDPEPYNALTRALIPKNGERIPGSHEPTMLLGPNPIVVGGAEQLIRGTVIEADTGKPRAGERVAMDRNSQGHRLEATTDKNGQYVIHGASKATSYTVTVESNPAIGMLRRSVTVPDSNRYEPLTADIKTARGVVITGRVTDRATGKPIPARIWVGQLYDNPHAKKPEYDSFNGYHEEASGPDGTFRIVAIPGRVLLMAGPDSARLPGGFLESLSYRLPNADPEFPNYFRADGAFLSYRVTDQRYYSVQGNCCKVIDVKPGVAEVRADVALERAPATKVSLRDVTGRPVAGTWLDGLTSQPYIAAFWHESPEVEVYGVEKNKPRLVTFFDPKNNLTATITLKGDEKQPVVVTLRPPGVLKGRLLNSDGTPAAAVTVSIGYPNHGTQKVFRQVQDADGCVMTNKDGSFRFDRMIPGPTFSLWYSPPSKQGRFRRPTQRFADGRMFGPVIAGETTDLGTLTLKTLPPGDDQ